MPLSHQKPDVQTPDISQASKQIDAQELICKLQMLLLTISDVSRDTLVWCADADSTAQCV